MALQDVADRLVAQRMAEVGKGPGDAVVPPVAVFGGEPDDQLLNREIDRGPTRSTPLL